MANTSAPNPQPVVSREDEKLIKALFSNPLSPKANLEFVDEKDGEPSGFKRTTSSDLLNAPVHQGLPHRTLSTRSQARLDMARWRSNASCTHNDSELVADEKGVSKSKLSIRTPTSSDDLDDPTAVILSMFQRPSRREQAELKLDEEPEEHELEKELGPLGTHRRVESPSAASSTGRNLLTPPLIKRRSSATRPFDEPVGKDTSESPLAVMPSIPYHKQVMKSPTTASMSTMTTSRSATPLSANSSPSWPCVDTTQQPVTLLRTCDSLLEEAEEPSGSEPSDEDAQGVPTEEPSTSTTSGWKAVEQPSILKAPTKGHQRTGQFLQDSPKSATDKSAMDQPQPQQPADSASSSSNSDSSPLSLLGWICSEVRETMCLLGGESSPNFTEKFRRKYRDMCKIDEDLIQNDCFHRVSVVDTSGSSSDAESLGTAEIRYHSKEERRRRGKLAWSRRRQRKSPSSSTPSPTLYL